MYQQSNEHHRAGGQIWFDGVDGVASFGMGIWFFQCVYDAGVSFGKWCFVAGLSGNMGVLFQKADKRKGYGIGNYPDMYFPFEWSDAVSLDIGGGSSCFWNRAHFCDIPEQ